MSIADRLEALVLTDAERNLLAGGFCPKCKLSIRGRFEPIKKGCHFLAPEIYATLRENRIELDTGHREGCELTGIRV